MKTMQQMAESKLKPKKKELRGSIECSVNDAFRAIAALSGRTLGDCLEEALVDWFARPENKKLIEEHNLRK